MSKIYHKIGFAILGMLLATVRRAATENVTEQPGNIVPEVEYGYEHEYYEAEERRHRPWKPGHKHHKGWKEYHYDYGDGKDTMFHSDFDILQEEGNVTIKSESCLDYACEGEWGAWQPWTDCSLPIPGNVAPQCHNTLRTRRRFCAQEVICHEVTWEFCAHQASCTGQWTAWSQFQGNCSENCQYGKARNRTCLSPDGKPTAAICLGSRTEVTQEEKQDCDPIECQISYTLEIVLIASSATVLLLLLVAIMIISVKKFKKKTGPPLSHVSSSSFLVSHWRIISQRFTRRARSEPHSGGQEIAIGNNYSAIHVYESADDYAEVRDNVQEMHYESLEPHSSFDGYEVPIRNTAYVRNQAPSANEYAAIEAVNPYAKMTSAGRPFAHTREMKRAKSVDDVLMNQRSVHRERHIPGMALRTPLHRGVSQLPARGLAQQPARMPSFARGGAASRIRKKMSMRQMERSRRPNLAMCAQTPALSIKEDRYGYLVPVGPERNQSYAGSDPFHKSSQLRQEKRTQTFASVSRKSSIKVVKSVSLPPDVGFDTYVTMKQPKTLAKRPSK